MRSDCASAQQAGGRANRTPSPELRVSVSASARFNAKLKINSASAEIIDATAAAILLKQPNHEMDFYELATAVFNEFGVDGVRRLHITRCMLRFRKDLEAARDRDAFLRSCVYGGHRLVPSLVDASFMQFILRLLSLFPEGLTEQEIAQYWLQQHVVWFGDSYRKTVATLGAEMLHPVLNSLLAHQKEWDIGLVEQLMPDDTHDDIRWQSISPFDTAPKPIIMPSILLEDFPETENHPVEGSLSYYLPPYNKFFLATPNAADESLQAELVDKGLANTYKKS